MSHYNIHSFIKYNKDFITPEVLPAKATSTPAKAPALTPIRHEEVNVCGSTILAAVTEDNQCFFSPRHVCDALGIEWGAQRVKIMADEVLAEGVSLIDTPSNGGSQKTTMLPIEMLPGWTFTIKKVAPEIQGKLNAYRREGFHALDVWFRGGAAVKAPVAPMAGGGITLADVESIISAKLDAIPGWA